MIQINVRDIINRWSRQNFPKGKFRITYDNGEVREKNWRVVFADAILLELVDRFAHDITITPEWSLENFFSNGEFTRNSLPEAVRFMAFKMLEAGGSRQYVQAEVYRVYFKALHELLDVAAPDICGVTSHDIIAINNDPVIRDIKAKLKPNPYSIDESYKRLHERLRGLTRTHAIAAASVSGTASPAQVAQCIGPIGYVADTSGNVIAAPILSGFNEGLNLPWELVAESLKARVSAIATDSGIAAADYIQRRLQLLVMVVRGYYFGDCGNDHYVSIFVENEKFLKNLKGITVLDPVTHEPVVCKGTEMTWIGSDILMRDFLSCRVDDPQYVCTSCFGKSLSSMPESDNVGYTYTYSNLQAALQDVLSTKHILNSIRMTSYKPDEIVERYLRVDAESDMLYFQEAVPDDFDLSILLSVGELVKLTDALSSSNGRSGTSLAKIGSVSTLGILRKEKFVGGVRVASVADWWVEALDIAPGRFVYLTWEFLDYLKKTKLSCDNKGNFIVPMTGWNRELPMFYSPHVQPKAVDWLNAFMSIIETNKDKATPYEKVIELFVKALERFDIGMTTILVIVYSMCRHIDSDGNEAGFVRHVHPATARFLSANAIYGNSASIGQLMPYEGQLNTIFKTNLAQFSPKRTPHPFDVMLAPHLYKKSERK